MPINTNRSPSDGFTLVEVALVLIILAILSGGTLTVLRAQSVRAQQAEARNLLQETREALLSFVLANGFLPCPANDTSGAPNCAGTRTGASMTLVGRVPWQQLGIANNDPWGQALFYKVSLVFTNHPANPSVANTPAFSLATQGSVAIQLSTPPTQMSANGSVAFALWSSGEDQIDGAGALADVDSVDTLESNDDVITWVSRYVLIGRLLNAGITIPPA